MPRRMVLLFAISVPTGLEAKARIELERRFSLEVCDLDASFLRLMRRRADAAGADWNIVLRADASSPDSPTGKTSRCLSSVACPTSQQPTVAGSNQTRPASGTARTLQPDGRTRRARLRCGTKKWYLRSVAPDSRQRSEPRPVLNHKAIPLSNPAQHVRINRAWLANKHRA